MSLVVPLVEPSVLTELARTRRHRRIENIDVFEVLYRAYIMAIVGGIAVLELGGATDDAKVKGHGLADVATHGAAVIGMVVAVGVALGLRSAARGGPISLEAPFVRHVLGSPISRSVALRQPIVQLLRRALVAGAVLGAVVGAVAFRRFPGAPAGWISSCALWGLAAGGVVAGSGLIGCGLRISRVPAGALGLVIIAWSALDVWAKTKTSPLTLLGEVALWPMKFKAAGAIGLIVAVVVVAVGARLSAGLSLEAAERRSSLVGALRFAATTRDLRAVVVLRRQLTAEAPRRRPWIRLDPRPGRGGPKGAVSRRDLQALLRWPGLRWARMIALSAIAGLCLRGVWSGTAPLILPAALCMWAVALEATEGLAQEIDHPDRSSGFPRLNGWLNLRHLLVPSIVVIILGAIGVGVACLFGNPALAAEIGGVTLIPTALAAVAGAAVSVLREPPKAGSGLGLAPEMAGMTLIVRELLPPLIALLGMVPILVARHSFQHHEQPLDSAVNVAFFVLLVPIATFGWVHSKDRFAGAMDMAKTDAVGRTAARSAARTPAPPPPPPVRRGPNRTKSRRGSGR